MAESGLGLGKIRMLPGGSASERRGALNSFFIELIGWMHGVDVDPEKAKELYREAAESGNRQAKQALEQRNE